MGEVSAKAGGGIRESNFLFGVMAMPASARQAVRAIYDFCRVTDDDTDLAPDAASARLAEWRGELEACFRGMPTKPATRALLPFIRRYGLKREYLEKLLDGLQMDACQRRYQNLDELVTYCECVAGTAGLLTLQVLGLHDDERARDYARNLAIALQLTNIVRDIGEDAAKGRIYIPDEDFASADYSEADLKARKVNKAYFMLCRYEIARIRTYFRKCETIAAKGLRRKLLGPEIMRATYEDLLRRMEKRLDDLLFDQKPKLSMMERGWIAAATWFEILVGG